MIETTLLNSALAMQGSSVMQLPAADATVTQKMENVNRLREANVSYAELLDAYQDRGPIGELNIYYRCYETNDGAVAIGALSASLWAKVRASLETDFPRLRRPRSRLHRSGRHGRSRRASPRGRSLRSRILHRALA